MEKYTYVQAVEYLLKIPSFAGKNTFENTKSFLHELGCYEKMENVIHIAGTNGKGSVCAFVQSCLLKAGYRVGMFTSPHLLSINERIRLDGEEVSDDKFAEAFDRVKAVVDRRTERGCTHPAFFEFIFGMACTIFEEFKPDYIILETGLGGQLDATNIIEKPLVTAITTIGTDHTEYLGDTIEEIAGEKAGIIKKQVPIVFDGDNPAVNEVIMKKATNKQAKTIPVFEKYVKIVKNNDKYIDFLAQYGYDNSICINLKSGGIYQIKNVHIALWILYTLDKRLDACILKDGIESTIWRGRMEWIEPYFLIDGAHNIAGIDKAIVSLQNVDRKIVLLFSAVSDKNYREMIERLVRNLPIAEVIVTGLTVKRGVKVEELKSLFDIHFHGEVFVEREVFGAVKLAKEHINRYENAFIFATGSLYLVSEVIAINKGDFAE